MKRDARWKAVWHALGATSYDSSLFERLSAAYCEPHRRYHTLQHLDECFERFDELRDVAQHPAEIELALWFHDAIYDVKAKDNEAQSAQWAVTAAQESDLATDVIERVYDLIMVTCHDAKAEGIDQQILVDVDLSILGAEVERFDEYELQVREEYAHVPGFMFRRGRRNILKGFLEREAIFSTPQFVDRYEAQARRNLERSIAKLS